MSPEYTLSELAELSGEPTRRIRSYIQQDLLPRPTTAGRNASYPDRSLNRLLAIKHLRTVEGLSVGEVRQALANLGEHEISELAEASNDVLMMTVEPSYRRSTGRGNEDGRSGAGSALQYIKNLRRTPDNSQSRVAFRRHIEPGSSQSAPPRQSQISENRAINDPADVSPNLRFQESDSAPLSDPESSPERQSSSDSALRRLLARLNQVAPSTRIKRRARSEEWIKIPITPDMELHVRKEFGDYDQAALEILADYIREAMAGGI
jgi:DNA-binding transcriptional MerR regulator